MRKLILGLVVLAVAMPAVAQVQVRGHTRKDGTYVAPHVRSSPNSSTYDNWSTKPNVNPYTLKQGSVDPFAPPKLSTYRPYTPPTTTYQPYAPPKAPCYFNCPK